MSHYTSQMSQSSQVEKKPSNFSLLMCVFVDNSESNITPRLRTVLAQWMKCHIIDSCTKTEISDIFSLNVGLLLSNRKFPTALEVTTRYVIGP